MKWNLLPVCASTSLEFVSLRYLSDRTVSAGGLLTLLLLRKCFIYISFLSAYFITSGTRWSFGKDASLRS